MASIAEHISTIRNLIKQVQNDSPYSDSFLFSILTSCSSEIIKREADSMRKSSDWIWHTFCMEMEQTLNHDCTCIPYGCHATRTIHEVPSAVSTRSGDMIKVTTLQGRKIPRRTEAMIESDKYDPIRAGRLSYFVRNRRIYLSHGSNLKAIMVSGVWTNLQEWEDVQYCSDDTPPCRTPADLELPVHADQYQQMYLMALRLLNLPIQLREDITSDANPEIKI